MRTLPSRSGATRSSGRVTSTSSTGSGSGVFEELGDELERRLVGPLQALDDDDERLLERDRRDEMADAADEDLLAVVRVLVVAADCGSCRLLVRRDLGEARDHRVRDVGAARRRRRRAR